MRRLTAFAGVLLLAGSLQLQAQRGGGHASAGGHGGFSGHSSFGGHSSGAFAGSHSGSTFASRSSSARSFSGSARSFSRPLSSHALNSRNFNRSGNLRIRTFGRRNNCFGYRCAYGYGYPYLYGGVDPYWWWNSDSSYNYDQDQQDQIGLANEMNAQSLDEQRMRDQTDQDIYARSAPPPPHQYQHQKERTDADPATVLVFRDQHKQEIQNYAIVGQTLWNFSPQRTQKIPLGDLDLPATVKANDDRGVDFHLPGANEGQ